MKPTTNNTEKIDKSSNHVYTYQNTKVQFAAPGIILFTNLDAISLVEPKAKSYIVEYYYCSN